MRRGEENSNDNVGDGIGRLNPTKIVFMKSLDYSTIAVFINQRRSFVKTSLKHPFEVVAEPVRVRVLE